MKLNSNDLIIRDVFSYDIEACHYNLLVKFGYDVSKIDKYNKIKRNIQIGKIMRDNETIKSRLRETTARIIDDYLKFNELGEDDIIIRQYDGIITKKRLLETTKSVLPLKLQNRYDIVLISIDRQKYIASDSIKKKIKVKGVANLYDGIREYYKKLSTIVDIKSKARVLDNLEKLRTAFIKDENIKTFAMPVNDKEVDVVFKSFGQITIKRNTLYYLSDDEVDKDFYYDFYLHPFIQSILLEILS